MRPSDRFTTPAYTPTEEEKQRDYTPRYHPFYDPSAMIPRVEHAPLGGTPDYSHLNEHQK